MVHKRILLLLACILILCCYCIIAEGDNEKRLALTVIHPNLVNVKCNEGYIMLGGKCRKINNFV